MIKLMVAAFAAACVLAASARPAYGASTSVAASPPHVEYSGPIIDVHLHTDPPASVRGVPNPVTGAKPASPGPAHDARIPSRCNSHSRRLLEGRLRQVARHGAHRGRIESGRHCYLER